MCERRPKEEGEDRVYFRENTNVKPEKERIQTPNTRGDNVDQNKREGGRERESKPETQ